MSTTSKINEQKNPNVPANGAVEATPKKEPKPRLPLSKAAAVRLMLNTLGRIEKEEDRKAAITALAALA
jgi:hypothetical protein